jgi:hypothetical protein
LLEGSATKTCMAVSRFVSVEAFSHTKECQSTLF